MNKDQNMPRIVVWEPYSTYVVLRVFSYLPVPIIALTWIAAYFQPRRLGTSWLSLALLHLWIHSNNFIGSFVFVPYVRHPSLFSAVAIAATIVTGYLLFRAVITPDRTTWLLVKLILPPIAIVSIPSFSMIFSSDVRKSVWWEITLLFSITLTALIHHIKRIRKETRNVR